MIKEIAPHRAVGYIRSDLADRGAADRAIALVADIHVLELRGVLVFDSDVVMPTLKLLQVVHGLHATTVITPAPEHLGGVGVRAVQMANKAILYSGSLIAPAGWRR